MWIEKNSEINNPNERYIYMYISKVNSFYDNKLLR